MARRITLALLLVGLVALTGTGRFVAAGTAAESSEPWTPEALRRGTEQTFLTFPEWYLVFSPAEYADHLRARPADEFPFLGHLRQFWSSYREVSRAASDGYPFNFGYHAMIVVIGTSTTVEYLMKSGYETLIGRVARATHPEPVTEDGFAARFAQDYVDFIRIRPWYEYDFDSELGRLWKETPLFGPGLIRRWERKYALTTELLVKALYARLIGGGTRASYEAEVSETVIVVDQLPGPGDARLEGLRRIATTPEGSVLAAAPRYQAFTDVVAALAEARVGFEEIAGNREVILMTVLVGSDMAPPARARLLFAQPILTRPGRTRQALVVRVADLAGMVSQLRAQGVEIEHVYDY